MNGYFNKTLLILIALVLALSACGVDIRSEPTRYYSNNGRPYSSSSTSPRSNTPVASGKYLTISVQRVTILKNVGDLNDVGEFQLGIIVINQSGSSAKMLLPGRGTYPIRTNQPLTLNREYGISVDRSFLEDELYIHFIGIDNDDPPPGADLIFSLFLDTVIPILEQAWEAPGGAPISVISTVLSMGAGSWYDWVKEQDIIAEKGIYLYAKDNWDVGTHKLITTDGNMEIVYTITLSDTPSKITAVKSPSTFQRTPVPTIAPLKPTPIPPTPTPKPTRQSKPICLEPEGVFRNLWLKYRDILGCSVRNQPLRGLFAEQPFQNGHMFWSQLARLYIITYGQNSGTWEYYRETEDPWQEGMPDVTCDPNVIRGFGGLWCSHPEMREKLGPPLDRERGFENTDYIQGFRNGLLFIDSDGRTKGLAYILLYDGTFTREPY